MFGPGSAFDHVFFAYTPKETSAAVGKMFHGFAGYVQADAKSVYDFLFRPPEERVRIDDYDPDRAVRREVGCWSHARTKARRNARSIAQRAKPQPTPATGSSIMTARPQLPNAVRFGDSEPRILRPSRTRLHSSTNRFATSIAG